MGVLLPPPCPWFQPCGLTSLLRLHAHQCEGRHVVLLRLSPGKISQLLPQDLENSSTILRLALAKCRQQTLRTEFVIALKHFREPIGIEQQPRFRTERNRL